MRRLIVLTTAVLAATPALAFVWPIPPCDSVHPMGNNWGNYQNYGGSGYFHNGIDIITPGRHNAPVVAIAPGWVKGWGTIQAEYHWRLAVCDSGLDYAGRAPGWLYAHIDPERSHRNLGDEIREGDTIGYLVYWEVEGFDHIHFARISDTGSTWQRFPSVTWWFIENPLLLLLPSSDLLAPVFEDARTGQRFAFCRNNTSTYLTPSALTGDVDIVARIHDKTGYTTGDPTWDKLAPFRIEHMIRRADGLVVRPWTLSLEFSNSLVSNLVSVVYKYDGTCRSRGDYDRREYFFIVTNTDGDSVIESADANGTWNTAQVGDGNYWVIVRASDHVGNSTLDSMLVTTNNGVGIEDLPPLALSKPLRISPNPGPAPIRVSFGLGRDTEVQVCVADVAGCIVTSLASGRMPAGDYRFETGELNPGIYFVRLSLAGDDYQQKLVVAR